MALLDEEERKKRYERARQLSNSINPSKTYNTTGGLNSNFNNIVLHNYQGNTNDEKEYISRFQRARQLSNSINPREDVPAPSVSEEELQRGHNNIQGLLSLMDNNVEHTTTKDDEEEADRQRIKEKMDAVWEDNNNSMQQENTDTTTINQEEPAMSKEEQLENQKTNFESYINKKQNAMQQASKVGQENAKSQNEAEEQQKTLVEKVVTEANEQFKKQYPATVNTNQETVQVQTPKAEIKLATSNDTKDLKTMSSRDMFNLTEGKIDKRNNIEKAVDSALGISGNVLMGIESVVPSTVKYVNSLGKMAANKAGSRLSELLLNTDEETSNLVGEIVFSKLWDYTEIAKTNKELNSLELENWRKETIQKNTLKTSTDLGKKFSEIAPSVGQNLVPMAVSYFNPVVGTTLFMTSAAGTYLDDAKERGMNDEQSLTYATVMGIFEGGSEEIVTANMLSRAVKIFNGVGISEKVLNSFGASSVENFVQEAIMEPLQETTATVVGGKDKANWNNILNRSLEAGLDGILSSIILNGASLGIASAEKVINNPNPSIVDIQQALSDTINSNQINMNDIVNASQEAIKDSKFYLNTENFFITDFDTQNEVSNIQETQGTRIENINPELNISPAVVKDNATDSFIVIDAETGLKLDTSIYPSQTEAIKGFDDKIRNLNNKRIDSVNQKVIEAKISLYNQLRQSQRENTNNITTVQDTTQYNSSNANVQTQVSSNSKNNNTKREYTKEQFDNITKSINQISDNSVYNSTTANRVFNAVSNNIENVEVIEQSGNRYINSLDDEGKVVYQQKLNNRPYTGKRIKSIVNAAIQNADKTNLYQEVNTNNTQTNQEPNKSNFYSNQGNNYANDTGYAVQDIKRVTEPFGNQESYSRNDMVDIWNNQVSNNNYDAYYDSNGNIERYIAIVEEGKNIVVNQYDNNDNVVKSEVIPSENGRYRASDIQDTLNRVASLYDENRPIKGQQDIEGNEVKSMKKKTTNNKNNIQSDIENFGNQVDAVLDGTFPKNSMLTLLKETPKPLQDIGLPNLPITMTQRHLKTIINETGTDSSANYHGLGIETVKQLPEAISTPLDIVKSNTRNDSVVLTTFLSDKQDRTIIASIKINGKGTINDIRIDTNVMTSAYGRNNYEKFMEENLKNGNLLYDIDRGVIKKVDRARLQLPRTTDNQVTGARLQLPGSSNSTTKTNGSISINSISQKNTSVKKNTATNKSMQNNKNNTSNTRSMKQNTNRITDSEGRTLTKQQQEYFKNSKIRDSKGNLQTVYHTSKNDFTVFDPTKTEHYRFGKNNVNYYTDNKNMSLSYSLENPKLYEGYLNITNPYVINAHGAEWNKVNKTFDKTLLDKINKITPSLKQEIINKAQETSQAREKMWNDYQNEVDKIYSLKNKITPSDKFYRVDELENLINRKVSSQRTSDEKEYLALRKRSEQLYSNYNNYDETAEFYKYFENNKEFDNVINSLSYKQKDELKTVSRNEFYEIAKLGFNQENIADRFGYYETTNDIVFNVLEENKSRKQKYDGVIIKNVVDYGNYSTYDGEGDVFVTFNSNQFKNANNTSPTSNEDIRFAKKSAKTPKVEGEILEPGQTNAQRGSNYIEQEIRKIEESGNWDDSIPVTKMTDIRKTIEDYLGIGIQKGHFRQQAYGIYKGNRDVIRTKELKDMDTILHETGHALDIGKRINLNKETISDELLKAVSNYGGYEAETREVQLEEGFAEVIREYTIVPNQARIDYPQTVAVLEGIRQTDKNFNNFINTVQQQTYNYIHQNPRNRTLSNVSIGERTDQTRLTPAKIQQEVMRNIYDKDIAIKYAVNEMQKVNGKTTRDLKASENAYYLTRLSSGVGDKVVSMLSKGYIDENGNKLMPGLDKLGEILGNDPSRFDDLRAYLVAQRDLEYKAKTLKTGIRTMDSKAVVEQFKNDTQIQEAAQLVYDTLDGVMQYAVNNGLISQETADSLRESNVFYVPMQRVLESNKNNVGRRGAVSDIIKSRTGSELDVKDVLENIVANSANIIQQVENNNILKALYNQGEQAGMTGKIYDVISAPMVKIGTAKLSTWEKELRNQGVDTTELDLEKTIDLFAPNNKVDTNNLITSFINTDGKRVYLQFNDEVLFNSLMNMDKKFMSAVLNINRKLNMPLRYGATMANIGFAIPNMISDTAQAAIFSEAGFVPVVDNVIGIMDILSVQSKSARNFFNKVVPGYADRINTLYAIYEQTGTTSSTRMSQYRERTQSLMKDVYGTKNSEVLGIKEKYKPLKRLLDIMTYIPELSEQSTRFRVFEKNLNLYRNKGMAETDARIQAALQSRDATQDFGRTGNITREINQLIPFSAARVGSAYTFAEKVKANPKRVVSRLAILMAISTAIKAIGYDDDEIEELNQRKKDDNFVLKIGDQVITIKKPQGILRSIINLGEYVQDLFTGHIEEGKEGKRLSEWLTNAIMDNMPADSVTGLVPNMIAPVVENAINKDLYYNSDIVKSYDLELPNSEQYYDYNSQLAIWLGKIFNYSPAKIDNLISGYFAGLGTSVTNVIDWIAGKVGITAEEPNMGLEDNAVGKRFFVNVNTNSASVDEVYTLKTDLTKKANGGTITEEEEKQLEAVTQATSDMAKLNKQIKEIKKSLALSADEKAEQIRVLQQQKTDTARQALGKDLLYSNNEEAIESTQFYPSRDTLSQNKRTLTLTAEMKKEYEEKAYEYYQKYESQGLYSDEKLEQIKEKAKDYAKSYMMNKYKSKLVRSEE